jgi:hypothetical protein
MNEKVARGKGITIDKKKDIFKTPFGKVKWNGAKRCFVNL